eukprot:CAMPEP_0197287596 /NCGR_PEP_ID=MMETSP0890-20130614/4150_1 /TAXON_ID=44058 ORGANISM="Aureoumbra lagunensis, Strain CCMP1510" /NCGR_SAMPLE_ID=MMETSP0890 /ASSEMBLY_ACC=CAM_ASM_000533 /LENGTH=603 /DNA_ID=CAMNT_0042757475 /DNA_START=59 /DNA_END=1869 /DNA_ORIENTATION=+
MMDVMMMFNLRYCFVLALLYDGLLKVEASANLRDSSSSGVFWEDVSIRKGKKDLVQSCGGSAGAGRLLVCLGPSGAGKTTLLRGLVSATRGLEAQGKVWQKPSGQRVHGLESGDCGLLAQDSEMFAMMTVYESLYFAYAMRGRYKPANATQEAIEAFGLEGVANSRVGDSRSAATSGAGSAAISGGERRRLCVAIELALCGSESPPKLIAADEPISGLDTVAAQTVIRHLRNYAKKHNIAAVVTLHAPSSRLWHDYVDDLLLMSPGGRIAYLGSARKAAAYFRKHFGFRLPPFYNPSEFYIDIVHDNSDLLCKHWVKYRRHYTIPTAFTSEQLTKNKQQQKSFLTIVKTRLQRFFLLYQRSLRQVSRDFKVLILRLLSTAGLAIFLADRYACPSERVLDATTVADRIALLTFSTVSMAMLSLVRSLDLVAKERPVVGRETERRLYSGLEYLWAKALAELPGDMLFASAHGIILKWRLQQRYKAGFSGEPLRASPAIPLATTAAASSTLGLAVGSLTPSADAALALGTPLMVIHLLTGIINPSGQAASNFNTEKSPVSLQSLSPIRHGVVWLIANELRGAVFDTKKGVKGVGPQIGAISLVKDR